MRSLYLARGTHANEASVSSPVPRARPWGATIFSPSFLVSPGERTSIFWKECLVYKQSRGEFLPRGPFVLCSHIFGIFFLTLQTKVTHSIVLGLHWEPSGRVVLQAFQSKGEIIAPRWPQHTLLLLINFFFNSQKKLSFNGTEKKMIFTHIIPRNSVFFF